MRTLVLLSLLAACGGEGRQQGGDAGRDGASEPCTAAGAAGRAPIPDDASLDSTITLGEGVVQQVRVELAIRHPYPRDLEVALLSPAGTAVRLTAHRGLGGGYLGTMFSDAASVSIADGDGDFTGEFRPEEALARLAGEPSAGPWTLRVTDDARGDVGVLDGWSLVVESCGAAPCAGGTLSTAAVGAPFLPAYLVADTTPLGSATVVRARVGVSITDSFDEDVDLWLLTPMDTKVELSTDNGGAGNDYLNTIFDDDAEAPVTQGQAPFEGRFRPEQPLSRIRGEPAAGRFYVKVIDDGPDEDLPAPSVDQAWLELDLCELACPRGTRAVALTGPGTVHVAEDGTIASAALRVSAEHGPLVLRGPADVALASREGPFVDAYFQDAEGQPLKLGVPPYSGHFQPEASLAALAGKPARGDYSVDGATTLSVYLCLASN